MEKILRQLLPAGGFGDVPAARVEAMRGNKGRNTRPEVRVRRVLHGMGLRFRLHRRDLPGTPDIVLTRYRLVIFVHGCFWHRHACRDGTHLPRARREFWVGKFERNTVRDRRARRDLRTLGWRTAVVWECQTRSESALLRRLKAILGRVQPARQRLRSHVGSSGS